ncbi:hypothetical protein PR048_031788 [Dryococelus australis]|uniref:Uncharacterized protein n=1 Tax=Dryococelus australis TaxID=614101 RepID=A0ABQ9G689_9NEOP|nr:hypothetical protein PR048_031788 [Dryococelus australis]
MHVANKEIVFRHNTDSMSVMYRRTFRILHTRYRPIALSIPQMHGGCTRRVQSGAKVWIRHPSMAWLHERLECSPSSQDEPGSIPGMVTPAFSQVGIVSDDTAGPQGFHPGSPLSPPPLAVAFPGLFHTPLISRSSALEPSQFNRNCPYSVSNTRFPARCASSIPGGVTPGSSHVVIVPDDDTGRRVFSGISRLPALFIQLHAIQRYQFKLYCQEPVRPTASKVANEYRKNSPLVNHDAKACPLLAFQPSETEAGRRCNWHREEDWGRNRPWSLFGTRPSIRSPGVISGNHGEPKSGWSGRKSNPGPPELHHLARRTAPFSDHTGLRNVADRAVAFRVGEPHLIPCCVAPGYSQAGIAPGDAADRRVFSGVCRFSRHCIPVLLHTRLAHPSSVLKTPRGCFASRDHLFRFTQFSAFFGGYLAPGLFRMSYLRPGYLHHLTVSYRWNVDQGGNRTTPKNLHFAALSTTIPTREILTKIPGENPIIPRMMPARCLCRKQPDGWQQDAGPVAAGWWQEDGPAVPGWWQEDGPTAGGWWQDAGSVAVGWGQHAGPVAAG